MNHHENAVLNFDLDFLQPNNIPNPQSLRHNIFKLKTKIIKVDRLLTHCSENKTELNNKTKELEDVKKKLDSTTQEYAQTSLDYKEALESSTRLDIENQKLKATVRTLQDECFKAVNEFDARESHVMQLEQLVKQQERKIESLEKLDKQKSDKLIEDRLRAKNKEYEKEILLLKKKCETLSKAVQYAQSNCSSLNEELLRKHEKLKNEALSGTKAVDERTENNHDSSQNNVEMALQSPIQNKDIHMDLDSDCCTENVCVDTGYGSSLASSDNEKCLNSPDYVFSPINAESKENIHRNKCINSATSPILSVKMIDVATSPILSVKMTDIATSPITIRIETHQLSGSQSKSVIRECQFNKNEHKTMSTSPITNIIEEVAASPVEILENTPHTLMQEEINNAQKTAPIAIETIDTIPRIDVQKVQGIQEKECLELYNSNKLDVDSTDNEIEMILRTMQLNHKLITPIPISPSRTRCQSGSCQGPGVQAKVDVEQPCPAAAAATVLAEKAMKKAAAANKNAVISRKQCRKLLMMFRNMTKYKFKAKRLKNSSSMRDAAKDQTEHHLPRDSLFDKDDSIEVNILSNNSCSDHVNSNHEKELVVCANSNLPQRRSTFSSDKKITVISEEIVKPAELRTLDNTQVSDRLLQTSVLQMELGNNTDQNVTFPKETFKDFSKPVEMKSSIEDIERKKGKKSSKITNLAKYRKKCERRKYKIRTETPPLKVKSHTKLKPIKTMKKKTQLDTSAPLNDADVYAKAVKVMAELNAKRTTDHADTSSQHKTPEVEESKQVVTSSETLNAIVTSSDTLCATEPLITSPRRSLRSPKASFYPDFCLEYRKPVIAKSSSSATVTAPTTYSLKSTDNPAASPKSTISLRPRSITSLEMSYTSLKPANNTLKGSISSPNTSYASSTWSIRSPEFPITRPKTEIMHPEAVITSPKAVFSFPKTTITSPKASITSPMTVFTSPKAGFMTPKDSVTSPKAVITSPKAGLTSPKASVTSPEVVITSPKAGFASPRATVTSLKAVITSPKAGFASPRATVTSPKAVITSPKAGFASPRATVTSPKAVITSPKAGFTPPKASATSSKVVITSPKAAFSFSNAAITSSNAAFTTSKDSVTSPKAITLPKAVITYSKAAYKSSKASITAPKASITSPKAAFTFPKASITSPKAAITLPKYEISSPKTTITSPKYSVISPKYSITSPRSSMTTRSQSKNECNKSEQCFVLLYKDMDVLQSTSPDTYTEDEKKCEEIQFNNEPTFGQTARKRTHSHSNSSDTECNGKRQRKITEKSDVDIEKTMSSSKIVKEENQSSWHPKESILCVAIQKYGIRSSQAPTSKISEAVMTYICEMIETYTLNVKRASSKNKFNVMNELVEVLQKYDDKHFVSGLLQYLTKSERKLELFNKSSLRPAPQMTEPEQVLLYLLRKLRYNWQSVDIVEEVQAMIEHKLFRLNHTPECDVVDSMSHFYALVCRYFGNKNRLITFMLDAMYCILFKSVVLIKQCLDVWPHVIPLAHMGIAKTPLVTCFVFLLHFFKCEDPYNRVQDIRNLLNRKYFYQMTDWNEKKMLDLFENAIKELRDISNEKKMLRIALIVLGKRQGPQWAQDKIINKILVPLINKENVPDNVKDFCISAIGPLMKPFPIDKFAACDIAMNQLANILNTTTSIKIQEAALTSLLMMSRQHQTRVNEILLTQKMRPMSADLEDLLRTYVRGQSLRGWFFHLSKMSTFVNNTFKS